MCRTLKVVVNHTQKLHKNKSIHIIGLNVRRKTMKLLEQTMGQNLHDLGGDKESVEVRPENRLVNSIL